jgi:predicted CXXCH cytochrome family protein
LNDSTVPGVRYNGVAVAVAPSTYNQSEVTQQVRVAYGGIGTNSWGNWCASCHLTMHAGSGTTHPSDVSFGLELANIYNAYVKSGDLSGTAETSFSSLVPFAEHTDDVSVLQSHANSTGTYLAGPQASDQVTCLSCHRAHASGFRAALRWNVDSEFMIYNGLYPGTDTTPEAPELARGRLSAETRAAYYDRPATRFASYQRVLCNKCHAKD